MILYRLTEYYERLAKEGAIAEPGFQSKEIPFILVIDASGRFQGIEDTRPECNQPARSFIVPHEQKRSGRNAWQQANLLWDNVGYVLGYSNSDPEKAKKQHASFKQKIHDTFRGTPDDAGVTAVQTFLDQGDFSDVYSHYLWKEIEKRNGNLSFRFAEDEGRLVCQRLAVQDIIRNTGCSDTPSRREMCLVSGQTDYPVRLHTSIKGVYDAQSTGANIVSYNLPAFNSFKKEQGDNAPIGRFSEFAYTTALNMLLGKNSKQRIQVGDATTVFWARHFHPIEEVFPGFFADSGLPPEYQNYEAMRSLLAAPRSGTRPFLEDSERFCVLGLAANASRLVIRFWYDGTIAKFSQRLLRHLDDCQIIHGPKDSDCLSLASIMRATTLLGKVDKLQPRLASDTMRAILLETPYPYSLLAASLQRIRAERDITYPRAAIIKAVLNRATRFSKTENQEVRMSLDTTNSNPGYLLGRLFAVLERIQESAQPGINATIRDRFYGSASSTPVAAFPHLMKLKNHHLAKMEQPGLVVYFEKQLAEIMAGLTDFPLHLDLPDQGRFAIGYYHQRQDLFTKKDKE